MILPNWFSKAPENSPEKRSSAHILCKDDDPKFSGDIEDNVRRSVAAFGSADEGQLRIMLVLFGDARS
jgi:hypothetical protein